MNSINKIQYLPRYKIDKTKWDQCIDESSNGLIYGYSFYLDHMSNHWDALLLNDYEAVMPLTWNKKFGFHYLHQPFLTASLGIFGKLISKEIVEEFIRNIPAKFKYCDIFLNAGNLFHAVESQIYERTNYILSLNKPYEELFKNFRQGYKQLLSNSTGQLVIRKNIPIADLLLLASKKLNEISNATRQDYQHLQELYQYLFQQNKAVNYGAYSANNKLIASAIFFFSHNRAYYILAGNDPGGRAFSPSHHLINSFIKDNAGKDLILDFEGSDVDSIAFFFRGFAAKEEKYACLKYNKLPVPFKWLKK